jgi:hypothetical protein
MEFHDTATILMIVFVILAISAVLSYVIYDVTKYKENTDQALQTEKERRASNVTNIVSQVNETNDDMSIQMSSSLTSLDTGLTSVERKQKQMIQNLDAVLRVSNSAGKNVSIAEAIDTSKSSLVLTQPTSVKNSPFSVCGSEKCVQIPDTFGNTYLTTLTPNKAIVLDAKVRVDTINGGKKLQFANDTSTQRHIVLWETADNEHQYFGFGIHANSLRYQVSTPQCSHVFATATGTNSSQELMRITGQGFVGIGAAQPSAPLHVHGGTDENNYSTFMLTRSDQSRIPAMFSISLGDGQGLANLMGGAYSISGVHKYYSNRGASRMTLHDGLIAFFVGGDKGIKDNNVSWNEIMRIKNQSVGILTTSPIYPLHINGTTCATKFIQDPSSTDPMLEKQVNVNASMDRYGIAHDATNKKIRMYMSGQDGNATISLSKALSGDTYQDLITVHSSGRFGIGLPNPQDALDVNGFASIRNGMFVGRGLATQDGILKIGAARTASGNSYLDLIGDTTYSDYGTRLIRYAGPNGVTRMEHNGTSPLEIVTNHAAPIHIKSNNNRRITIHPDGKIEIDSGDSGILLKGNVQIQGNLNVSGQVNSSR